MTDHNLFSAEHVQLIGLILIPIGSGIIFLIWQTAQAKLKIDQLYEMKPMLDLIVAWFVNHGSDITGYQPGDEFRKTKK